MGTQESFDRDGNAQRETHFPAELHADALGECPGSLTLGAPKGGSVTVQAPTSVPQSYRIKMPSDAPSVGDALRVVSVTEGVVELGWQP